MEDCAGGAGFIPSDGSKQQFPRTTREYDEINLWTQRELLASQTLTDLAKNCKKFPQEEEDRAFDEKKDESALQNTAGEGPWARYVPPSHDTSTTLKYIDQTEKSVPHASEALEEMMDIAHALDGINCDQKRRTETEYDTTLGPKQKKRRRRRHEIVRNFKCPEANCTKSYGSEGALKTHIRLKHVENPNLLLVAAGSLRQVSSSEGEETSWASKPGSDTFSQNTAGSFPMDFPRLPPISSLAGDGSRYPPLGAPFGAMNFEFVLNQPKSY